MSNTRALFKSALFKFIPPLLQLPRTDLGQMPVKLSKGLTLAISPMRF